MSCMLPRLNPRPYRRGTGRRSAASVAASTSCACFCERVRVCVSVWVCGGTYLLMGALVRRAHEEGRASFQGRAHAHVPARRGCCCCWPLSVVLAAAAAAAAGALERDAPASRVDGLMTTTPWARRRQQKQEQRRRGQGSCLLLLLPLIPCSRCRCPGRGGAASGGGSLLGASCRAVRVTIPMMLLVMILSRLLGSLPAQVRVCVYIYTLGLKSACLSWTFYLAGEGPTRPPVSQSIGVIQI